MAGNKGRGRAAYTFNIEAVGFSRGEKLPDVVLKPPPLFPDTDYKPVPLKTGEGEDYMLALKQELRETMRRMPYFIETPEEKQASRVHGEHLVPWFSAQVLEPLWSSEVETGVTVAISLPKKMAGPFFLPQTCEPSKFLKVLYLDAAGVRRTRSNELELTKDVFEIWNQDIERYNKRYMKVYKEEWIPDWRRLPREMMPRKKCKKAGPNSKKTKDTGKDTSLTNTEDVLKKIEELEKKGDGEKSDEENDEKEGSKEKSKEGDDDDDEDEAAEQEEYDEEEQEEENDYINSYFEDGDDFGADSDDNMDEATY